jgi:ribonucleoside-diphosphate reductase alpha chain
MQAALQAFVDNSLSKTVNFPENATEQDVATGLHAGLGTGLQGHHGLRDRLARQGGAGDQGHRREERAPRRASARAPTTSHDTKKPRPRALTGKTFSVETPLGKAFITINENGGDQPFEAFINTAKAGSETAAVSEAIGRMISYILRMASPTKATHRCARSSAS